MCHRRVPLANGREPAVSRSQCRLRDSGLKLVNVMDVDAVDAGGLDESWRQQPATPVYTADLDIAGVREALRKATRERKPGWRATPKSPGSFEAPA